MKPETLFSTLLWILSLAFLSVGTRNFEAGITLDAPFYASIARNIARTGNWFTLNPGIPDLNPFYGNTHAGFWVLALWLKIMPAQDWSIRIVGHLYYVAFLFMFFLFVKKKSGETTATVTILLLWIWFQFSNTHSSVYLDPGALFWGTLSLIVLDSPTPNIRRVLVSGSLIGTCALYKSFTFLGFLPAWLWVGLHSANRRLLPVALASFIVIMGSYIFLLNHSSEPLFLESFWSMQITNRFARVWNPKQILNPQYWKQLNYYTYYLSPIGLLAFRSSARNEALLPMILSFSFILFFSFSRLVGGQYLIYVMPSLAWLIGIGVRPFIGIKPKSLIRISTLVSIMGVCLLQYFPFRTHSNGPTSEQITLGRISKAHRIDRLILEIPATIDRFVLSAPFAWYGDVSVEYPNETNTQPERRTAYFLHRFDSPREKELSKLGWCKIAGQFQEGTLWVGCSENMF